MALSITSSVQNHGTFTRRVAHVRCTSCDALLVVDLPGPKLMRFLSALERVHTCLPIVAA